MSKFDVKIKEEKHGGYYLSTTRNGYQWLSMPIDTPEQMRQIANALIDKADKIEYEQLMNEPNQFCEDCGCVLHDENTVEVKLNPPSVDDEPEIIYICSKCNKE